MVYFAVFHANRYIRKKTDVRFRWVHSDMPKPLEGPLNNVMSRAMFEVG